jgi:muconolactone delta-isomerase
MKILALEQELPRAAARDFQRLAGAEATKSWELYQAGVIRELYFRQDRPEAVLILECADVEEAAAILATLPFVEAGLITFEIIPLAPYPGFARLFAEANSVSSGVGNESSGRL